MPNIVYVGFSPPHSLANGSTGLNSLDDFCLWAPPTMGLVGDMERITVAWCTKPGHGARVIPAGALTGVHFVKTPKYIQITGQGNFTKLNIPDLDDGGELDNHGADVRSS